MPADTALAIGVLKGVAAHYVMRADDRVAILERQLEVLTELVAALVARGPEELQPSHRADFAEAGSDAARLRVVVDQVASLTDASARGLARPAHRRDVTVGGPVDPASGGHRRPVDSAPWQG